MASDSENKGLVLFGGPDTLEIPADAVFPVPTGLPGVKGGVYYTGAEIARDVKRALAIRVKKLLNERWDAAMGAAAREASPIKKA